MGMEYEDKKNQPTNQTVLMSSDLSQSETLEADYLDSNPSSTIN